MCVVQLAPLEIPWLPWPKDYFFAFVSAAMGVLIGAALQVLFNLRSESRAKKRLRQAIVRNLQQDHRRILDAQDILRRGSWPNLQLDGTALAGLLTQANEAIDDALLRDLDWHRFQIDALSTRFATRDQESLLAHQALKIFETAGAHCKSLSVSTESLLERLTGKSRVGVASELATTYLAAGAKLIDFRQTWPFGAYVCEKDVPEWQRIGRVLALVAQLGPDNTHPDEYTAASESLMKALKDSADATKLTSVQIASLEAHLIKNCDRLLFNATEDQISKFFTRKDRERLIPSFEKVNSGQPISKQDIDDLIEFTRKFDFAIEYQLVHLLVILSSKIDRDATLNVICQHLDGLTKDSSPIEIDFFHASIVYIHVFHGLEYNADRFNLYEERILKSWHGMFNFTPGSNRGQKRGFRDPFDQKFEDGFGVIYPYGVLFPSSARRRLRFADYSKRKLTDVPSLALYEIYLKKYLSRAADIDAALAVLQALAGIAVTWPIEGLLTIRPACGHHNHDVRRAAQRIVAEAASRWPNETRDFLHYAKIDKSVLDSGEVEDAQRAKFARRQVSEEEWARIAHLILKFPTASTRVHHCVLALISASSLHEAIVHICQQTGLCADTAR